MAERVGFSPFFDVFRCLFPAFWKARGEKQTASSSLFHRKNVILPHNKVTIPGLHRKFKNMIYRFKAAAISLFAAITAPIAFSACDDDKTYAELRETENKAIAAFVAKGCSVMAEDDATEILHVDPIKEISEQQFYAQDSTTDVSANEYVLFAGSGVYMQIVRQGSGEAIADGESAQVVCRFHEYNISSDSLQLSNRVAAYEQMPDIMSVTNNSGTFSASFTSGLMRSAYNTSSVPGGWLIALPFVKLGRQYSADSEVAQIRLIVPSTEGHTYASNGVYACFYEIIMQRGR